MTALAAERVTQRMDSSGQAAGPDKLNLSIGAGAIGFQGGIACISGGFGVNASSALGLVAVGRWTVDFNNATGANGAIAIDVEQGVFKYAIGTGADVIAQANVGQLAYVIDDQTMGLTNGGGTRSIAGPIMQVDADGVWVKLSVDTSALAGLLLLDPGALPQRTLGNTRQVRLATTAALAAYAAAGGVLTATANGALSTIDGVAPAVGDRILLVTGAAGADNGIYTVTSLGGASAKWVFTRAADYATGSVVYGGLEVSVSEGTLFAQSEWFLQTAGASTVDTAATAWYPRSVTQSVVLVAGTVTISNVPVLSATKTGISSNRTTPNTTASTIAYNASTITPGAIGTASVVFQAQVAAGTINNVDVSTLNVTITNG